MNAIENHFCTMSEGRFHVFMTERKTEHRIMTQFRSEKPTGRSVSQGEDKI